MDRMIYLTMNGAKAAMQRQDVLANNLANASTPGFRAEMQAFRSVPIRGDGATTRVFGLETTVGHDNTPGPITATGRPLDVAVQGNAWLAVQGLDGLEAYTRNGGLEVAADGTLTTRTGLPVMGDGGPIQVPAGSTVAIGSDGTVSARQGNGRPNAVGRLKLVTPEDQPLKRGTDGLFRAANNQPLPADATARVQDGALEGSNVSAVETMVAMIAAARQFEHQMKLMQTADQGDRAASKLLGAS
jgi:flagellar basal-body rod protein FlgF